MLSRLLIARIISPEPKVHPAAQATSAGDHNQHFTILICDLRD
jgi:hypothetical protein